MVSDRKILWFPSKWGVNHLKRWRNGEVVGKKRIMNYSQKLWPGTASWLVYYSMCQGPFFHHKGAFNKNALLFLEIWLLLAEMYCLKVEGPTFYSIMIKFLGVKKQIFVIFP